MQKLQQKVIIDALLRLLGDEILTSQERWELMDDVIQELTGDNINDILARKNGAHKLRLKRGTTDENDAYTGLAGELTMDTNENTLRLHDGTTPGGTKLAKNSEIPDVSNITGKFCVPDYTNRTKITTLPFTAPATGVCIWTNTAGDGTSKWHVNNIAIFDNRCRDYINIEVFVPLGPGDVLSYTGNSNASDIYFYPYKFV